MKVLEISNLDYKWALGVSINDLSKPYRELNPIPNERDYYIYTFGTFENISVGLDFGAIERMWSNNSSNESKNVRQQIQNKRRDVVQVFRPLGQICLVQMGFDAI